MDGFEIIFGDEVDMGLSRCDVCEDVGVLVRVLANFN